MSVSKRVQSFTRTRPAVSACSCKAGLVVKVAGEVFGGRVELGEGLEVVDHLVVEVVDDGLQQILQQLEVEQQAGLVEFGAGQRDQHTVVVAVGILALAVIVAQVVAGGEAGFYGDFKHAYASLPS